MASELQTIDGAQGEGGGQIFRTALTLAMCLGKPVRLVNIRAGRSKPGLLRQHLCCLRAAEAISGATVTGAAVGSQTVTFAPGAVKAGSYRFTVGTAGSTSLVFQTVLYPLLLADGPSELWLEGGTHNGNAPSFDYLESCFLPVLKTLGYPVAIALERYGFYPAGGGVWRAQIQPARDIKPLNLVERGELLSRVAVATSALLPAHITQRELTQVQKKCHWQGGELQQRLVQSSGPGNLLSLRVAAEHCTEVVEVVGELQLSAERVAGRAINALNAYLRAGVPVGSYLADQLLLPMVLGGGGCFTTLKPSQHLRSNAEVIRQLSGISVGIEPQGNNVWRISAGTPASTGDVHSRPGSTGLP